LLREHWTVKRVSAPLPWMMALCSLE
jgi:hypothetical protein